MGSRLKGKVAVVTGSGRGIGKAEAMALAAEGAKIVVNDVGASSAGAGADQTPAQQVVDEIKAKGGEAVANYDSVTTEEGGKNIIKTAIDKFGRIDIVVNNAGILRDRIIFKMTEEEFDAVIKVHLYGTYHVTRPATEYMREQRWGRIINTSSSSGLGSAGQANYSAAKEGIIGFTRTVARDLGRYGVTCNAIRPVAGTRLTMSDEMQEQWKKAGILEAALKSMEATKPEMIAPFVVFLCTDEAANINGYDFMIAGGQIGVYSQPAVIAEVNEAGKLWTVDELVNLLPNKITGKLVNPAPVPPAK